MKETIILPPEFLNFQVYKAVDATNVINFLYTDNQKQTLIVSLNGYILEKEQIFLSKILKAIKYNIKSDVVLLTIDKTQSVCFQTLCKQFDIKKVILFGGHPKQLRLHFNIHKYQPLQVSDYTFLWAEGLAVLMNNQNKKRQLWDNLKTVFL